MQSHKHDHSYSHMQKSNQIWSKTYMQRRKLIKEQIERNFCVLGLEQSMLGNQNHE